MSPFYVCLCTENDERDTGVADYEEKIPGDLLHEELVSCEKMQYFMLHMSKFILLTSLYNRCLCCTQMWKCVFLFWIEATS